MGEREREREEEEEAVRDDYYKNQTELSSSVTPELLSSFVDCTQLCIDPNIDVYIYYYHHSPFLLLYSTLLLVIYLLLLLLLLL